MPRDDDRFVLFEGDTGWQVIDRENGDSMLTFNDEVSTLAFAEKVVKLLNDEFGPMEI
jgi:hypothetical protein